GLADRLLGLARPSEDQAVAELEPVLVAETRGTAEVLGVELLLQVLDHRRRAGVRPELDRLAAGPRHQSAELRVDELRIQVAGPLDVELAPDHLLADRLDLVDDRRGRAHANLRALDQRVAAEDAFEDAAALRLDVQRAAALV